LEIGELEAEIDKDAFLVSTRVKEAPRVIDSAGGFDGDDDGEETIPVPCENKLGPELLLRASRLGESDKLTAGEPLPLLEEYLAGDECSAAFSRVFSFVISSIVCMRLVTLFTRLAERAYIGA